MTFPMKKTKIILFFFLIIVLTTYCKKDKIETDPRKAILGKWELIEMGNWPQMDPVNQPNGYKEYMPDSILREYDYNTGDVFIKKYWIDSLLNVSSTNGGSPELLFQYKFEFYDNKLRLDVTNFYMLYTTSIYKRF